MFIRSCPPGDPAKQETAPWKINNYSNLKLFKIISQNKNLSDSMGLNLQNIYLNPLYINHVWN